MEASRSETAPERDSAEDWRIAPGRAPATVAELEGRIDVAVATAHTAEEAALEIGAASLEAAEQARRAATLAERAAAAAARVASEVATATLGPPPATPVPAPGQSAPRVALVTPTRPSAPTPPTRHPDPFDERITAFRQRAEKVMIRLQKLEAGADPSDGPSEVVRLG